MALAAHPTQSCLHSTSGVSWDRGSGCSSNINKNNLVRLFLCLFVKGIFGGSLKITPKNSNNLVTYRGVFLLTVKLLCLQSLKALIRRTFPLSKETKTVSKKTPT